MVFVREDKGGETPAYTSEFSSVAEAMLEEATVETGAARMPGEAEIRAPVVSPEVVRESSPKVGVEPTG